MEWSMNTESEEQSEAVTPSTQDTGNTKYPILAHYLNDSRARKVDTDAGQCIVFDYDGSSSNDDSDCLENIKIKREIEENPEQNFENNWEVTDIDSQSFKTQVGNEIKRETPEYLEENAAIRIKEEVQESYEQHGQFWMEKKFAMSALVSAHQYNALEEHNYFFTGGNLPENAAYVVREYNPDLPIATTSNVPQPSQLEAVYECGKCKHTFRSEKLFKKHVRYKYCRKRTPCRYCRVVLDYEQDLEDHLKICEEKMRVVDRKECAICKRQFQKEKLLKKHERMFECEKRWKCPGCSFACKTLCSHKNHVRECINIEKKDSQRLLKCYECSDCKSIFDKLNEFQKHMKSHKSRMKAFKFECTVCGQVFAKKRALVIHERMHLPSATSSCSSTKSFPCKHCDKQFKTSDNLLKHEFVHTGVKPFLCELCQTGFMSRMLLDQHKSHSQCAMGDEASERQLINPDNTDIKPDSHQLVDAGGVCADNVASIAANSASVGVSVKSEPDCDMDTQSIAVDSTSVGVSVKCEPDCTMDTKPVMPQKHEKAKEKIGFECDKCSRTFSAEKLYQQHMRFQFCRRITPCKYCGIVFEYQRDLEAHWKTCEEKVRVVVRKECAVCKTRCKTEELLKRHEKVCDCETRWKCRICGLLCTTRQAFNNHVRKCNKVKGIRGYMKYYECSICNKISDELKEFQTHKKTHKRPPVLKLKCTFCGRGFAKKAHLLEHESTHTDANPHTCNKCYKDFSSRDSLKRHEFIHTGLKPFTCKSCHAGFMFKSHQDKHKCEALKCQFCNRVFENVKCRRKHEKVHEKEKGNAKESESSTLAPPGEERTDEELDVMSPFAPLLVRGQQGHDEPSDESAVVSPQEQESGLNAEQSKVAPQEQGKVHIDEESTTAPVASPRECKVEHKCCYCNKILKSASNLAKHEAAHKEEKKYTCPYCDQMFRYKKIFTRHKTRKHGGSNPYKCRHCKKRFDQKQKVVAHERTHTIGVKEKQYPCTFCDKSFNTAALRTQHAKLHTGQNRYPCRFCDKVLSSIPSRTQHEKIHKGIKAHSCRYCDKTFRTSSACKDHERTHTGERPFSCDFCDDKFARKRQKDLHERIHTGFKPHQCNFCDKSFARKDHLKYHIRIHTGEKPLKCQYCDKCFATRSQVFYHERVHTQEETSHAS